MAEPLNNLPAATNVSDLRAVVQSGFEKIDGSLAFMLQPSRVDGVPTEIIGPPDAGAWVLGELWVDALLAIWRCSVAGTPGTWVQEKPAVVAAEPGDPVPAGYLIRLTTDWSEEYWDGAAWQVV